MRGRSSCKGQESIISREHYLSRTLFLLCSASTIDVAASRSCIGYSTPVATSSTADAVIGSATPKYNCSLLSLRTIATFGPLPLFAKPDRSEIRYQRLERKYFLHLPTVDLLTTAISNLSFLSYGDRCRILPAGGHGTYS